MTTFYATYSASAASGSTVTALQGTDPWIVAGDGVAGTPSAGVLTVQGNAGGTPIPISGSITADNASVGATGAAVPASATYVAASVAGTLTGLVATANGLKVDGSAVTQPISGTVAATQSGPWTVQPGNTANTTPWLATIAQGGNSATVSVGGALKVDASGSTQPVSGTVAVTQSTSPWVNNVSQFGGSNVVTGTGTSGSGIPRFTVSSDSVIASITNALPAGTNAIGSVVPTATAAGTFQAEGSIAFGSLTNAYATILTPSASTKIVFLRNNTNASVSFSFDAGTTTNFVLDSGDQVAIDYVANGMLSPTTAIQVKYTVGAPTSGSVRVNACH